MEKILPFILENWRFLLEILLSVVLLLIAIFKKKVKVNIPDNVWIMLPGFIKEAEEEFGPGTGTQKLQFVIKKVLQYINVNTGISLSTLNNLVPQIVEQIEEILKTPTKKGD